jgi:para-nitrobenzyl esterase
VPFMIGINEDETTTLVPAAQRPPTAAAYEAQIRTQFPLIAEQVLARYPAASYTPVWRAYTAIFTDVAFICPAHRAARDHAARGNPVRAYYFTQSLPQYPELGAFHAIEIGFLYSDQSGQSPALQALAVRMKQWWSSFARDGVPIADGAPAWPLHPATGTLGLDLNASAVAARSDYRKQYCDFWAQYVAL